jgi:restriction system protein
MGRRRREGGLIEALALLPWWACLLLAALSYVLLSALAAGPVDPRDPAGAVLKAAAGGFRWALPILFTAAAALSFIARRQREALLDSARQDGPAAVASMSWRDFELLIGEAFRQRGYRVQEHGAGGADGGIDLVLTRDGQKTLVQCKHWKAYKVGVSVVRELFGVMTAKGAARGIVVTSGRFTDEAAAFAKQASIDVLDGTALAALIEEGRASKVAGRTGAAASPAPASARSDASAEASPDCPDCGAPMTQRVAKRGANEGRAFWGCSTYPRCRGTRAL